MPSALRRSVNLARKQSIHSSQEARPKSHEVYASHSIDDAHLWDQLPFATTPTDDSPAVKPVRTSRLHLSPARYQYSSVRSLPARKVRIQKRRAHLHRGSPVTEPDIDQLTREADAGPLHPPKANRSRDSGPAPDGSAAHICPPVVVIESRRRQAPVKTRSTKSHITLHRGPRCISATILNRCAPIDTAGTFPNKVAVVVFDSQPTLHARDIHSHKNRKEFHAVPGIAKLRILDPRLRAPAPSRKLRLRHQQNRRTYRLVCVERPNRTRRCCAILDDKPRKSLRRYPPAIAP